MLSPRQQESGWSAGQLQDDTRQQLESQALVSLLYTGKGPTINLGAFIIRIGFWGYYTIAIIRKPRGTEK